MKNGLVCRSSFLVGEALSDPWNTSVESALEKGIKDLTRVEFWNPTEEPPFQLQWGNFAIPVEKILYSNNADSMAIFRKGWTANAKLNLKDFQDLAERIPKFKEGDDWEDFLNLKFNTAIRPSTKTQPPELWGQSNNIEYETQAPANYLSFEKMEEILTYVDRGYPKLNFDFEITTPIEGRKKGTLTIEVINENGDWFPEVNMPKLATDQGVYGFQLINKKGEKTVIKMDTTSEKYRWMYEQYRDGKELDIVHIPNFQTVRRVITWMIQ